MCRKKKYKPTPPRRAEKQDVQAVKQAIRIKIWQIIARNNSEFLSDPLIQPLKSSMPYVENAAKESATKTQAAPSEPKKEEPQKVEDIEPKLDDVLPLPEKAECQSQKPKKKAKDLLTKEATAKEEPLPGQITVDEAIDATKSDAKDGATVPMKSDTATPEEQTAKPATASEAPKPAQQTSSEEDKKKLKPRRRTIAEVLQEQFEYWRKQAKRKEYFQLQDLQVKNKNAACYELLEFLDEI